MSLPIDQRPSALTRTKRTACSPGPPEHRRSPTAFTLVELLVVMAIIGVLMALLLPALARVRDRGLTVHCMSNLRQLGGAMHQHAADQKGRFPTRPLEDDGIRMSPEQQWDTQIARYVGLEPNAQPARPTVFACPTSPLLPELNTPRNRASICSYKYNQFIGQTTSSFAHLHTMESPSKLGVLSEYIVHMNRDTNEPPRFHVYSLWPRNHNQTISWGPSIRPDRARVFAQSHGDALTPVLFADGHVGLYPTVAGFETPLRGVLTRERVDPRPPIP